jgi:hypothetical protein
MEKDDKTLADTVSQNDNFYHPAKHRLSDMLVLHQLQQRQREREEQRLFGKTELKDIVGFQ